MVAFWDSGFDGVDTDTLSRRMAVSKPRLYRHFGNKEGLFLRTLDHYERHVGASVFAPLAGPSDFAARLRGSFERLAENVTGRYGPTGCLLACVATAATRARGVRAFLFQESRRTRALLARQIRAATAAGDLPDDGQVEARARVVQDLIHAIAVRGRMGEPIGAIRTTIPVYLSLVEQP